MACIGQPEICRLRKQLFLPAEEGLEVLGLQSVRVVDVPGDLLSLRVLVANEYYCLLSNIKHQSHFEYLLTRRYSTHLCTVKDSSISDERKIWFEIN